VKNLKNLYSFILNSSGLTFIFTFLTEPLFQKNVNGWPIVAAYVLALFLFTTLKPKILTHLIKISLLIRLFYVFINISELPVSILVFLFSSLSLEVIVLISLNLELDEACYYEPDNRILTNPTKHEKVEVSFGPDANYELSLVNVSENYMTLISMSEDIEKLRNDYLEGTMVLRGKVYNFRATLFWKKGQYYCLSLSRDPSLKDNHWPLIYDKIKSLKVI